MISEISGVGKVEFLGCLGTDVPSESRNREPVKVGTLGHIPQTLTIKQQTKDSFNLTVLGNIIQQFCFIRNQNHLTRRSPMAQTLSLDLLLFSPTDSSGVWTPSQLR